MRNNHTALKAFSFIIVLTVGISKLLGHEDYSEDHVHPQKEAFNKLYWGKEEQAINALANIKDINTVYYDHQKFSRHGLSLPFSSAKLDGAPILQYAFKERRDKSFKYLLVDREANVNLVDFKKNTMLHQLAYDEYKIDVKPMKDLLVDQINGNVKNQYKPDLNAVNYDGNTPLHLSIVNYVKEIDGHKDTYLVEDMFNSIFHRKKYDESGPTLAEVLANAGADPMIKNNKGHTALDVLDIEIDKEKKRKKSHISSSNKIEYQGNKISKSEKIDIVYNEKRARLKAALMRK